MAFVGGERVGCKGFVFRLNKRGTRDQLLSPKGGGNQVRPASGSPQSYGGFGAVSAQPMLLLKDLRSHGLGEDLV